MQFTIEQSWHTPCTFVFKVFDKHGQRGGDLELSENELKDLRVLIDATFEKLTEQWWNS